ncbi:helix-turn-helix domain-containing protein [Vagococcus bubulae]|uniref:helix-turn-helix domain-containing protein n=1 Tax=Vagococcus bubulae TaxID=1977868 RepID=UPI001403573C|nr:helix-turn-helix domain-containing protein [Vagococcus bubulae]
MIDLLLEPKIKMTISVINIIYNHYDWTQTSYISKELNISERTVQHYIKDILEIKQEYDLTTNNQLSIDYLKIKGIKITDYSNDFEDFKKFVVQSSQTMTLLNDIINQHILSVTNYCQVHFLSETTVRKNIKRIRETCHVYGIDLVHLKLVGDERKIRYFIALFDTMISRNTYFLLDGINYEELNQHFDDFLEKANFQISDVKKEKTLNIFLIHLQRISFNQLIIISDKFNRFLVSHPIYPYVEELFHHYYVFNQKEIAYFFYIMTLDEELNRKQDTNLVYNFFSDNQLELMTITDLIFCDLFPLFRPLSDEDISLMKRDIFYTSFVTMVFNQLVFEYKYGVTVHYNLEQYPLITSKFTDVINKHLIDTGFIPSSQLNILLQQYFFRFLYFVDPKHLYKVLSIHIEPAFDYLHQKQIKEYLNLYFNHQISYQESYSKEQTDIVLTPFHETSEQSLYADTPIIMVKFPLDLTFLQKVETIIKEKQKKDEE